jgi:uncharacterized protein YcnI
MNFNRRNASGLGLAIVMFVSIASAHIRIVQTESTAGGRERYTMRVPNESKLDAVKVEGEFPAGLKVYAFEFKPGWKVDLRKDADGNIAMAILLVPPGRGSCNPMNSWSLACWRSIPRIRTA